TPLSYTSPDQSIFPNLSIRSRLRPITVSPPSMHKYNREETGYPDGARDTKDAAGEPPKEEAEPESGEKKSESIAPPIIVAKRWAQAAKWRNAAPDLWRALRPQRSH